MTNINRASLLLTGSELPRDRPEKQTFNRRIPVANSDQDARNYVV